MKDRITGKLEEIKGKMTGDKGLELRGRARQKVGDVKQTAKEVRHDIEHRDDDVVDESGDPRTDPPESR
jgi:uncharacterized protein YjbJ (UPF0337 family)